MNKFVGSVRSNARSSQLTMLCHQKWRITLIPTPSSAWCTKLRRFRTSWRLRIRHMWQRTLIITELTTSTRNRTWKWRNMGWRSRMQFNARRRSWTSWSKLISKSEKNLWVLILIAPFRSKVITPNLFQLRSPPLIDFKDFTRSSGYHSDQSKSENLEMGSSSSKSGKSLKLDRLLLTSNLPGRSLQQQQDFFDLQRPSQKQDSQNSRFH